MLMNARLTAGLLIAALVVTAAPARAANERVEKARKEIRSSQEEALIVALRGADEKRQAIEASIARLERKINEIQGQLDRLRPEMEQARLERDRAQQAAEAAALAFDTGRKTLAANAMSLYATGNWTDVFTMMATDDVASLASARVYLDSVVDSNARIVNGFRRSRDRLDLERKRVVSQTEAILAKTKRLEAERQRLISLAESKQRVSNQMTDALAARADALAAIASNPAGFDLIVRSYGNGTAAIKLLIAASQAGQPVDKAQEGSIWQPVLGRITSGYGPRIHPIYKYKSFHTGVDMTGDQGQPIRAGRAGTVVDVIYLGAYGLTTVIDHGFSVATMYAHQARTLVSVGEEVQAGQVIGAVGCTGWCTGPHSHFEVWSRGSPQNPLRWL